MIKLTDRVFVAADRVQEVSIPDRGDGLHVRMKDGRVHWVPCDYGKSEWDTSRRLVALIDSEQARGQDE